MSFNRLRPPRPTRTITLFRATLAGENIALTSRQSTITITQGAPGEYQPGGPGVGTIRQITYADGRTCHTGQELGHTTRVCPSVGEQPIPQPGVTAAGVRSPVSVTLGNRAVHLRDETKVLPMFIIRFRARVPVTSGSSGYFVSVSCGVGTTAGPVFSDVRRDQIITREVPRNGCRGIARIRVLYQHGGHTYGLPFSLNGAGLTVGTRTIVVH